MDDHEHEQELFDAARAGSAVALTALYRDHHAPVLRYLRGRLPDQAEDLASHTWLDAARNLHRFTGGREDFRRWLFTIARRRLQDELRRRARRPSSPIGERVEVGCVDPGIEGHGDLEAALALVRRLPPDQADAVLLRVVGGLDVAQVAELMQRTEGSVRVLVHRGLARLRVMVERSREAPVTERTAATMRVSDA